jgi:hypothetical protein
MKPFISAALLGLSLVPASMVFADVVELKTGQRVEGTLKQADQTNVAIEVGGQTVTFKADQVRAIYYGTAPSGMSAATPAGSEALGALKALQSVTAAGVAYRDYSTRVGDTKIQVDKSLRRSDAPSGDAAKAIETAMGYYVTAGSVWNSRLTGSPDMVFVSKKDVPESCQRYPAYLEALDKQRKGRDRDFAEKMAAAGMVVLSKAIIQVYWACASDQIAEAEKLLAGEKK